MAVEDRDKALAMALSQIEKQFGKGSVMRMGENIDLGIEAIPTGALSLDLALGIGGLPRGRIVEIFGPESSGKCLTADTYVWTDRGLETVQELFERCGQPATCTSRVTPVGDLGVRAVNERGELEKIHALTHNGRRPVFRIRLASGREVMATENHPLRVVNERGFVVWRQVGKLVEGDTVVSALFGATEAAEGDGLSEDEAVLLGYLVAEGSLGTKKATRLTNTDPEVAGEYTRLAESLWGSTVRHYGDTTHVIFSKALRSKLFERYGLEYVNAAGKSVPYCIRTAGHKIQRAFLSALFEGGGWIDSSSTVGLTSASEQLALQVQLLLYGLGIPCTVSSKENERYRRSYWTVTVNSAVGHRFLHEIGFRSQRRARQVAENVRRSEREHQFENVPNMPGILEDLRDDVGGDRTFDRTADDLFRKDLGLACSRARLKGVVEWAEERSDRLSATGSTVHSYPRSLVGLKFTYERVVSIEPAGTKPTFDLAMPATHSFLANGILSHNTTLAVHVVAEAQRNGGICAYIDSEHAMDPAYARSIGVNIDDLLISQPDNGEQALEIADMLIRSSAIDVIVIDSVAALTPRAEIEGEMGDSHVGLQARLMSQALRKLAGSLNKSNTVAIFINQLREKIGVLYGCFSYETRVVLADGSTEKIGKIVNQRMPVEVLSYDHVVGAVVPKRIVNWFDNGKTDEFLQFAVAKPSGNGRAQFAATRNHLVRTPAGWREAGSLAVGDRVLQAVPHRLSNFQWEVLRGMLMGAAAVTSTRSGHSARVRFSHCEAQVAYADWKASLFANLGSSRHVRGHDDVVLYDFEPLPELAELRRSVYVDGKKVFDEDFLKRLTPLSLALWYADDGSLTIRSRDPQKQTRGGTGRATICVEPMEPATRERLLAYLSDTWGITATLVTQRTNGKTILRFTNDETAKLHALIAPYVHPSVEHKLLPAYRGRFEVEPHFVPARYELMALPVLDVHVRPPTSSMDRFDIEVEGSHNYLVDGVVVHNSPETTPGGRALKFYASVRLDIRRTESIKDGADVIGNRTRVKVVKNKVGGRPFQQAEFDIMFGTGISREGSLLDVAVDLGLVKKSGAWFTYEGEQLGQGRENVKTFLRENPQLMAEIDDRVRQQLMPKESPETAKSDIEVDPDDLPITLE